MHDQTDDQRPDLTEQLIAAAAEGADAVLDALDLDQPTPAEQALAEALAASQQTKADAGNDFLHSLMSQAHDQDRERFAAMFRNRINQED